MHCVRSLVMEDIVKKIIQEVRCVVFASVLYLTHDKSEQYTLNKTIECRLKSSTKYGGHDFHLNKKIYS